MVGTIAGVLMATVLNNGGGAWDNAKKYIETGHQVERRALLTPPRSSVTPSVTPSRTPPDRPCTCW